MVEVRRDRKQPDQRTQSLRRGSDPQGKTSEKASSKTTEVQPHQKSQRDPTRSQHIVISASHNPFADNGVKIFGSDGFKLADGRTIRVKSGWRSPDQQEVAFLHEIGGASCEDFTTVLGPDADAAHQDHLHLDLARHSKGRHVCKGGQEPVPQGGRMLSFFEDRSIDRTGSIPGGDDFDEDVPDTGEHLDK